MNHIPHPTTVDMAFQSLIDSMNGTESLKLTHAQRYMEGVLQSEGVFRNLEGNEGFFESVGNGFKKVWEYIKNVFSAIFGGSAQKDVKEKTEATDAEIVKVEENLEKVTTPPVTTENVEAVVKKVEQKVESLPESPEKKKIVETVEEIKKEPEKAKKVAKVKVVLPEVFELSLENGEQIKKISKRMRDAMGRLKTRKEEYEKDGDPSDMGTSIQTYMNGLIGLPDAMEATKDLASAKAFLAKAKRCNKAMEASWTTISNSKQHYKEAMDKIQGEINNYDSNKDNKALQDQITQLKVDFNSVSGVLTITGTVIESLKKLVELINKSIIVVI